MFRETISSDESGLLVAEQSDPRVIPSGAGVVYRVKEPNSYGTFGISTKQVARNPINADRMQKKGTLVGADAGAEYEEDVTPVNLAQDMQGVLFADIRYKSRVLATATDNTGFTIPAGGVAYTAGTILAASGATLPPVNGRKVVGAGSTGTLVAVTGLAASTGQSIELTRIGRLFAAGDAKISLANGLPALTSDAFDLTVLGFIVGEWVYIGGDTVGSQFANSANNGFARIINITSNAITFDKTSHTMVADAGAGKSIELYFGNVLKNEKADLARRRVYALRRRLGKPDDTSNQTQSEVVFGAVAQMAKISIPEEDKLTVMYTYMASDWQAFDNDALIVGTIVEPQEADAYNSTGDAVRARMAVYNPADAFPQPLIGIFTDFDLTFDNNTKQNKAVTRFAGAGITAGQFAVSGSFNAYFSSIQAVNAVKNNSDVTFDLIEVKANKAMVIDFPLMSLSTDGVDLKANDPAMLSVDGQMGTGRKINPGLDHVVLFVFFPYVPNAAAF